MHIAIIGGGFAGAACALHLLRDHPHLRVRLTIIEQRAVLGAGLAYSTPAPEHRTNVPAARMSVLPDDPGHFHRWLESHGLADHDPAAAMPDGRLYPARAVFGRYVDEMLRAQAAQNPEVDFRHIRETALSLERAADGFDIGLSSGDRLHADIVVLAVSHSEPDLPAMLRPIAGAAPAAIVRNPWDLAAIRAIPATARILVVGTGLTACDVVASLVAQGHRGPITAVSRHGLLPRPRTVLPVEAEGDFTTAPEHSAAALLHRVRAAIAIARQGGRPWENIIDALRQQAASAWGTLDWSARRRVLRHLRTYWDVHRFQCAPQIDEIVRQARNDGLLRVEAAHLVGAHPRVGQDGVPVIEVTVRPRGSGTTRTDAFDGVINCTGPGHRSVTASHPLLRGLAERGDLQADPAALGIWVDSASRVLRADGSAWPNLFVAGPLARGTHGELMGLPQVNTQPREVAGTIAGLSVLQAVEA